MIVGTRGLGQDDGSDMMDSIVAWLGLCPNGASVTGVCSTGIATNAATNQSSDMDLIQSQMASGELTNLLNGTAGGPNLNSIASGATAENLVSSFAGTVSSPSSILPLVVIGAGAIALIVIAKGRR
jgi:hypothetical protein